MRLSAVVLIAVVAALCFAELAAAVTCNCFNGKQISTASCACGCTSPYLPPTCTYTSSDRPNVLFYVNMSRSDFNSELFVAAVNHGAMLSSSDTAASERGVFVGAESNDVFGTLIVTVELPGYAVARLLRSVQLRDPWVSQYAVVSAYPQTPTPPAPTSFYDVVIANDAFGQRTGPVTATGVAFLAAAALGVAFLLCIESCCMGYDELTIDQKEACDDFVPSGAGGRYRSSSKTPSPARRTTATEAAEKHVSSAAPADPTRAGRRHRAARALADEMA